MSHQHRKDRFFETEMKSRLEVYFLVLQIFYVVILVLVLIKA